MTIHRHRTASNAGPRAVHSRLALCVFLVQLPVSAPAQRAENHPIRQIVFGGDADFPPYEFLDKNGQPAGLNVDLIRAVGRLQGFAVRVRLGPWPEIRAGVQNGSIDVATMFRAPKRAQEVDFAIAHELIYQEMFVRRGTPPLHSLADLAGKRLLMETNTITIDTLTEMGYGNAIHPAPSEPEALRALIRGDGDVAIVTQTVTRPFQERAEFSGRIVVTGPPVLLTEYAYATRKGRPNLIEALNQGVAAVKASGEYERIFDRWLRPDTSAHLVRKIAWAAAAILGLALLVIVWNRMLQRRVTRQAREIGDLGTSYRELADYQAEIDRANKELEAFSYSVSHDLRAPLRTIGGYTGILLEDYSSALDAEGKRICGVISETVQHMGQLIDDLLSFSRLSRTALEPVVVDMHALAASEYGNLGAQGVRFELEPLPGTVGDPRLLRQVWVNLLSNAVKFSAKREQPVIRVTAEEKDGECIYIVEDNGAGFDMRYASKLFGVFQRLHSAQEFEGTGVGLAIVQRIVERHGGRVWAESQLGQGATFRFALPKRNTAVGPV